MAKPQPNDLVCDIRGCRKLADGACALCDQDACDDHLPVVLTASFETVSITHETAVVGGTATKPVHPERVAAVFQSRKICGQCARNVRDLRTEGGGMAGTILEDVFPALVEHLRNAIKAQAAAATLQNIR